MSSTMMGTDYFGVRLEICSVGESQMEDGQAAYIFYLDITNLEPKARLITVSKATYITKNREQLEQDIWLSGYLVQDGRLMGNAHRKAGLVFYKRHLDAPRPGDSLYVDVGLTEIGKTVSLRFDSVPTQGTTHWAISEVRVEDVAVRPSHRALSKLLNRRIERLEAFEEKLGVHLDRLSVKVSDDYSWLTVLGEIHQASSSSISQDVTIVAVVYDAEGEIVESGERRLYAENFAGFDVFELPLNAPEICLIAEKIRVFPEGA